jgi:hypothetical protein
VLVALDYDPERTVDAQLDKYAEQYAMDRDHLTAVLVDHVRLKAA